MLCKGTDCFMPLEKPILLNTLENIKTAFHLKWFFLMDEWVAFIFS